MLKSASLGYQKWKKISTTRIAKGGGSGTFYAANRKKSSRPAIYGNKNKVRWTIKHYNGAGIYQKTTTKTTGSVNGSYIKILYK